MCGLDRGAIGQRNDGADIGDCREAPTHVVVADDGQQAAMQDAELLAKHPADNKQWFDQGRRPYWGVSRQFAGVDCAPALAGPMSEALRMAGLPE